MRRILALVALTGLMGTGLMGSSASFADDIVVTKLQVTPEKLVLSHVRDSRGVLVQGVTEQGDLVDLTGEAKKSADGAAISIDDEGFVAPVTAGTANVVIQARGLEVRVPVEVTDVSPRPMDFIRDVEPFLSKMGCSQGTCHGGQQGKKGFKLSLRGYDPVYDYRALVDDVSGRRFNRANPSDSLMLLKPTQAVPHEGGFLFDENSRAYLAIKEWIAEGCQWKETPRPNRLEIRPENPLLHSAGQTQQLQVIAYFPDGSTQDVTRETIFETSNFEVNTVSSTGVVKAVRRGEAAVLVKYEGAFANTAVTVLGVREGYAWRETPEFNFIDTHVNNKLKRLKILPSELCTDAEFLRRVSLDLTGLPPTAAETREFLSDSRDSQTKRTAKIDELLESPGYVDQWSHKWSDLLLSNRKFINEKGVWAFRNWMRQAVAENQPYDEFVYELMTASGSTLENPAANYYRIAREPREAMENMTQVFLGTRFVCAQCHDHPFERWTQQNYFQLSAYFGGVGRRGGKNAEEEVIYDLRAAQPVIHVGTGQPTAAKFPFPVEGWNSASELPRVQLAKWLTSAENPYFAKSLANRYWSYFFGKGIIDPVDDIRLSNPATNAELLEALTADFVDHKFDTKHLIRTIVTSATYQRTFKPNSYNEDDDVQFSHAQPRRLTAESLLDAIMIATGAPENLAGVPAGFRATQLPDSSLQNPFLDMFGRAPRESPCECERTSEVSLAQTLTLINGPTISDAIAHPQGLIARLVQENADAPKMLEELYLATINRYPNDTEVNQGVKYLSDYGLQEGAQDLMWALINSPAFLFNR